MYIDLIGISHSFTISREIYVMRHKCHVSGLRFHFKRKLIMRLDQ